MKFILLLAMLYKQEEQICNQTLLNAYSFLGHEDLKPKIQLVEMCPRIQMSCCTKEDQQKLFGNWDTEEKGNVHAIFEYQADTYKQLLERVQSVTEIASKIIEKQKVKKIGNCKIMSQRIVNYSISSYMLNLKEMIDKQKKFFTDTYSGFYCSVCDYTNQGFYDLEAKTITFSESFCRDIVQFTLPSQLYFHQYFVKMANLVTKFVAGCSINGVYNVDSVVNEELLLEINSETLDQLERCKTFRNDENWFNYCEDFCLEFKLIEIPQFFGGYYQKVEKINKFIQERIKAMQDEVQANPITNGRVLDETEGDVIFHTSTNSSLKLEQFTIKYDKQGIDLYITGLNSDITSETFDKVEAAINLQKKADQGIEIQEQGVIGNAVSFISVI